MPYVRPQNPRKLSKEEKNALVHEYLAHCRHTVQEHGLEALNAKIPRDVFAPVLEAIGETLLEQADRLVQENADVQTFLSNNPLPPHMADLLPENFRVFSLLLNALKQWVSAESAATDKFLLGGMARDICRAAVSHCLVTGEPIDTQAELHHPVRDGRPPVLLSKKGHDLVERVAADAAAESESVLTEEQSRLWHTLQAMRSQRNKSWVQLREGCAELIAPGSSPRPRAGAVSFARVVARETGMSPQEICELLTCVGK